MHKVYFDLLHAQPMDGTKFHGGGEYIKSVFHILSNGFGGQIELHLLYDMNLFLDDWILKQIRQESYIVHNVQSAADICNLLNEITTDVEVTFFTGMIYKYQGLTLPEKIRKIGVCHGLRPIEKLYDHEEWRYLKNAHEWKEYIRSIVRYNHAITALRSQFTELLSRFDVIVTDSLHSKYSIRCNLPQFSERIYVCYAPLKYTKECIEEKTTDEPYIMMISANRWLKNSYRGVKALDMLYERNLLSMRTKIYGNMPSKIRHTIKHEDKFDFIDYVSSEELELAYKNCKIFFYPTLNEGFGLPPMEAMKYGTTCVISAVSSLCEIYGDSVYYCNPYDLVEMGNRILMAVDCPIDIGVIEKRFAYIRQRQDNDMARLCGFIVDYKEK